MIENAKKEGHKKAEQSFAFANKVESIHANLYKKALNTDFHRHENHHKNTLIMPSRQFQ